MLQDCLKRPSFACSLIREAKFYCLDLASRFSRTKLKLVRNFLVTAKGPGRRLDSGRYFVLPGARCCNNIMLTGKWVLLFAFLFSSWLAYSQTDDPLIQRLEKIYSSDSNEEISEFLSSWGSLSPLERRFLLSETRTLLDKDQRKNVKKDRWINVRVKRRYGSSFNKAEVNRFVIRSQGEKKTEGNTKASSVFSKFGNSLQNREKILNVISRSQYLGTHGDLEFSRATYGSGVYKRRAIGDSANTNELPEEHEVVEWQKKI